MSGTTRLVINRTVVTTLCALGLATHTFGQNPQDKKPPTHGDDVVRLYTYLVQTDVMVFDKQGRFVSGLNREDFELRIGGKPQPIDFFEHVTAGSTDEEAQLSAARGGSSSAKQPKPSTPAPLDRSRTIFFYVDDLHLSARSLKPTRDALLHFIDNDMGHNDRVAVTSASGQIGFLQQLSDNKDVLHAAVDRLKARSYYVRDQRRPPMSEYQALQIDRHDRELTNYFVEELMKELR